jgi:protein SCO1/2
MVDQQGQAVTLQQYRGKYVVLAPFLTLCQDECPITTGAFQVMQASVAKAGLASQVVFIEMSVDPERDSPARLLAYQNEFGADWTLLTGTSAHMASLRSFFGVYAQEVPESNPPALDWWTHKPLTYDVDHTNGFILIDPQGDERWITTDLPLLNGKLSLKLRDLLDEEGYQHLEHGIQGEGYTIPQAVDALSWLVQRHIPIVDS